MGEQSSAANAVGTFFNVLERLVLFALSLSVGLLNLVIGLVVAAHLGVIPKTAADRILHAASRGAAYVTGVMGPPRAAPKHKTKTRP